MEFLSDTYNIELLMATLLLLETLFLIDADCSLELNIIRSCAESPLICHLLELGAKTSDKACQHANNIVHQYFSTL